MKILRFLGGIAIFILIWWLLVFLFKIPSYIIPSPIEVTTEFLNDPLDLLKHFAFTFIEAQVGLIIAWVIATGTAFIFFLNPKFERAMLPILVGFKAIPLIAIAPLLILWFGNGFLSKCIMAATICFFPIVIGYLKGFRHCTDDEVLFLRSLELKRYQELMQFRLIKATPFWLAGLKVASSLAVVGAIVAEFSGANNGLGYIVIISATRIDTPLLMVGILLSAICGITLFWISVKIESLLLNKTHLEPLPD